MILLRDDRQRCEQIEETAVGSEDDNLRLSTHERMSSLMTSQAKARELQGEYSARSEFGQKHSVAIGEARAIIALRPRR